MKNKKRIIIIAAICIIVIGIITYMIIDSRKYIGEKITYTGEPVEQEYTTYNYYSSSGSFEKYFIDNINYNYIVLMEEYVKSEGANADVVSSFNNADFILSVPVVGNMYEYTSLMMVTFYDDTYHMFDGKVMQVVVENDKEKLIKWNYDLDGKNDGMAWEIDVFTQLKAYSGNDEIIYKAVGVKADTTVMDKKNGSIVAKQNYFKERVKKDKEIYSRIPKYQWTSKQEFTVYPYGKYGPNDVYDVQLSIPLLNKDLEEGVYQTFIFLNKSNIVAEVVVSEKDLELYEYKGNQTLSNLPARYKKYKKNKYIDEIQYSKVVCASWTSNPGFLVKGVIFHDKQYFPYGEYNGEMWVYYYKSDTFERYEDFKKK